jgi:hypothetical protein
MAGILLAHYGNPAPLGQIRDKWRCLGLLLPKLKIPSTKLQINFKRQ